MVSIPKRKRKLRFPQLPPKILPWLDVIAIAAWGMLLLYYWQANKLELLIQRDFFWLIITAGIGLLVVAFLKFKQMISTRRVQEVSNQQHISVFPPGWGSVLLLVVAISGFLISPQVFASDHALNQNLSEILSSSRVRPQSFRSSRRPEERTLIDWVRTLSVYPEPDAYTGQKAKVTGFAIHPPETGDNLILLSRFVITCCAADAYPIALPVKLEGSRQDYPPDTWLEVEGKMITENIAGTRRLTIAANNIKKIPRPQNPYSDERDS